MRYESACCGYRVVKGTWGLPQCTNCCKTCEVVDNLEDPGERERAEREKLRNAVVKALRGRKRRRV